MGDKKKCFVVTPIGDKDSPIRRHIEGIIDQAIEPAIGDKYDIIVSHRINEIGSINSRVIELVYQADLVIANLTTLNPNVMFELAMRYSFGKPVITIAEQGTKLPFDITTENTIFYYNDPTGAAELKDLIREFEEHIDFSKNIHGPIFATLERASVFAGIQVDSTSGLNETLKYVVDSLEKFETRIIRKMDSMDRSSRVTEAHIEGIQQGFRTARIGEICSSTLPIRGKMFSDPRKDNS